MDRCRGSGRAHQTVVASENSVHLTRGHQRYESYDDLPILDRDQFHFGDVIFETFAGRAGM
jgi:hypothetical protein